MSIQRHYPSFNVMDERKAWDDHTRSIVESRLNIAKNTYQFLSPDEAVLLELISSVLMDDDRKDIILYIVRHMDETLYASIGESQRKPGIPEAKILIRDGLKKLEEYAYAQTDNNKSFRQLTDTDHKKLLEHVSKGTAQPDSVWATAHQKDFFQKILQLTIEAYCSHPTIWSEIGYAGPAYPRGYVRADIGHLDPWEAQPK